MTHGSLFTMAALLSITATLSACCPGKSGHDSATGASAASASVPNVAGQFQAQGVLLQATPSVLDQCTTAGRAVEISWQVSSALATSVRIWVKGPDGEAKIWTEGGQAGKLATDAWTVPGTQFTLTDDRDKPLARLIIGSSPCAK